jgi:RNA polymerase sigma-70 factor (ECF subfamily)
MHSANLSLEYIGNDLVGQSDLGLVMAARAGSDAAFAELHQLYARRLYKTIFSITKNHEDAEDALQETLMRAFLALASFEGRSKFLSWLTRIAINSSLMTLRKRRVRREESFECLCGEDEVQQLQIKDPSPTPEELCLQLERNLRVVNAVAQLKPPLRAVMEIRMNRECSMKEIAQSLDVSLPAVKARINRARRRLTKRMQNEARILPPHTGSPRKRAKAEPAKRGQTFMNCNQAQEAA